MIEEPSKAAIIRALAQASYEFTVEIVPGGSFTLSKRIDKAIKELRDSARPVSESHLYRAVEILAEDMEYRKQCAQHIGKANAELAGELDKLRSAGPKFSIDPETPAPATHLHFHLTDKHKAHFVEGPAGREMAIEVDQTIGTVRANS